MESKKSEEPKDHVKIITNCEKQGFYGEITLKFRHGQVVHVIKSESIKLD